MEQFLFAVICLLLVGYCVPRLLLWWVRRTLSRRMGEMGGSADDDADMAQGTGRVQERANEGTTTRKRRDASSRAVPRRPIGDDEGEYIDYEEVAKGR